jgi:hypothetical protein
VQIKSTQHALCKHRAGSKKISQSHRFSSNQKSESDIARRRWKQSYITLQIMPFLAKTGEYVPKMPLSLNKTKGF